MSLTQQSRSKHPNHEVRCPNNMMRSVSCSVAFASAGLPAIHAASTEEGPCDIFAKYNTPCQAAHSLTRPLYAGYKGPLYQVMRMTDGSQLDIGTDPATGVAAAPQQDSFCGDNFCMVHRIYDQSPNANHLDLAPPGGAAPMWDRGVDAKAHKIFVKSPKTAANVPVYGALFQGKMGYRNDVTKNIAVNDEPETIYAVMNGRTYNDGCCFDYGNAETNNDDDGKGTMEAVYFGNCKGWGQGAGGKGPWVMADLENGLWAGNLTITESNTPINADFVTAMVKGDSANHFAIKAGSNDNQKENIDQKLKLMFDGPRPMNDPKYMIMKKQGAIILGIGGDNSNSAIGAFYEGVMTSGFSQDVADDEVQANIAAMAYSLKQTSSENELVYI